MGHLRLLAMLAITLWRRFPYGVWRRLHRVMPILYLMAVFHGVMLAPSHYWAQPVGLLLSTLMALGTASCIVSLTGRIGRPPDGARSYRGSRNY